MNRMDRMLAIIMALQQRAETSQSLADKLEVSKRTVLRDIQSLSEIGVPITALSGPGGGYRLMDGYRLPPLQLDTGEAMALLLAIDGMSKYSDSPFQQARWTVLDKIRAILPEHMLKQLSTLLQYIEMEVPERHYTTPYLSSIMDYISQDKWIQALYRSESYQRYVEMKPLRIYAAHGFWYCEAYSILHGEKRTFRVDRFVEIVEIVDPMIDVSGSEMGDTINTEPPIRIIATFTYRGALIAEQDPHIGQLIRQKNDDEWEIEFDCPYSEWKWAIQFFYRIGLDAEVVEPHKLRQEIKELASSLVTRYE